MSFGSTVVRVILARRMESVVHDVVQASESKTAYDTLLGYLPLRQKEHFAVSPLLPGVLT